VDRLPLLTWVMFLKFLDDLEASTRKKPNSTASATSPSSKRLTAGATGPPRRRHHRRRAAGLHQPGRAHAPRRRQRGKGLFAYLRGLAGEGEKGSQREVIANVFKGVQNRMVSGYLLRDIINKINGIHFSASEEIHTLSHLYESMLREMRDAAGDSASSTPRARSCASWCR
jgi:type I restriction enzyme M protein